MRWRLGLAAVALLVVGTGWYQAFTIPPYFALDEQAHVGYVLELQGGRLPTIDTPIAKEDGGPDLRQQVARVPERNRDVWVANNPPLGYLPALVPAAVARVLDLPGGPLLGLRLTNLAAFGLAAVFVARLARRLADGNVTAGLIAGAAFATLPHVGTVAGFGFVDGVALLAAVAALDALVAIARDGPTRRQVVTLSAWCALAVGVRPMSAVLAGAAAAVGLAIVAWRWWSARGVDDRAPVGPVWTALVLGLPTLLLNGWYYLRNQRLYGDPTGSEHLFEKFLRTARPNALTSFGDRSAWQETVWIEPLRTLFTRRLGGEDTPSSPLWLWHTARWGIVVVVLVAVGIVVGDQVLARRRGTAPRTPALGWAAAAGLAIVTVGLTAQHFAGGGNIHPRYLLFCVVVLAAAAALAVVRLHVWWAGIALVGALVVLQIQQIPRQNRGLPQPGWAHLPGSPLTEPIGPAPLRYAGFVLMALGLVAFVVLTVLERGREPEPAAGRSGPS